VIPTFFKPKTTKYIPSENITIFHGAPFTTSLGMYLVVFGLKNVGITHVLGHIFSNIAHQGLLFHGAPFTTFLTGTAFDFAAKIRKIRAILPAIIVRFEKRGDYSCVRSYIFKYRTSRFIY
jgi:hypothetical protein